MIDFAGEQLLALLRRLQFVDLLGEPRLIVAQLLLDALQLGDVARHAEDAERRPVIVVERHLGAQEHGRSLAIGIEHALLDGVALAGLEQGLGLGLEDGRELGAPDIGHRLADDVRGVGGPAEDPRRRRVGQLEAPVGIAHPDRVGRGFEQFEKQGRGFAGLPLAVLQRLVRCLCVRTGR